MMPRIAGKTRPNDPDQNFALSRLERETRIKRVLEASGRPRRMGNGDVLRARRYAYLFKLENQPHPCWRRRFETSSPPPPPPPPPSTRPPSQPPRVSFACAIRCSYLGREVQRRGII
ncbi:hypothetical protein Trydic_g11105 [Trypoxylus dichotomus]